MSRSLRIAASATRFSTDLEAGNSVVVDDPDVGVVAARAKVVGRAVVVGAELALRSA
jgi:hypothetical protein